MTSAPYPSLAARQLAQSPARWGPWLWSPRVDVLAFGGSALAALGLVWLGRLFGFGGGDLPEWGWVAFILMLDVAHVYSTLFRTYLDRQEVARRPLRYLGLPALLYLGGVALYAAEPSGFWRVLAYLALFHFIRQQVGWVALYRSRAGQGSLDRLFDDAALYSATLGPVLYWHAHLTSRAFSWFMTGDFVEVGQALRQWVLPAMLLQGVLLVAFLVRQFWHWQVSRALHVGKLLVVLTTSLLWNTGIVFTNSDFDFTVTNVIAHAIPYMALLYAYSRALPRGANVEPGHGPVVPALAARIVAFGPLAFVATLLGLAVVEEALWHNLVYADHPMLFGIGHALHDPLALSVVVPLLGLPQLTHYVLDGIIWRRSETRQLVAQRRAIGVV